jgi:hypothetical protein
MKMTVKKLLLIASVFALGILVLTACAGPAGSQGPKGDPGPAGPKGDTGAVPSAAELTCTACHNDTNIISGKATAWEGTLHSDGELAIEEGGNKSCAGCHTGNGFSAMVAAGLTFDKLEAGVTDPTSQDCRACHQIHTTYTIDDFALETTAAVAQVATGTTFDGGAGNLCANCHQSRRVIPALVDGKVDVSSRFGPHHGPQSNMLVGVGGAGSVTGSPSGHYSMVKDTCVGCHMGGEAANHTFEADLATCATCHADIKSFDYNGVQTAVSAKLDALQAELTTAGLLDATGAIVAGKYDEAQAIALWNYILVKNEDRSLGVHNSKYTVALLDAALAVFGK